MFDFTDLREQLASYLTNSQVELISKAYLLAKEAHEGQTRYTGEPYITHPVEVARILCNMHMDHQTIMACLLHDVLEDTTIEKKVLSEHFGEKVAELVDGVSKLKQIRFESKAEAQAENFRKMMLAMSQDIRVIIIKLADRLHNMRTLAALPFNKQRRIAIETLEIYAPIAGRLGMNQFKVEYEDFGFATLYPFRYRVLKEAVRKARGNRRTLISTIEQGMREALSSSHIEASVWGREKHLYSLYKKMRKKKLSFSEVLDVYAFRILVKSVDLCYRSLGAVHNLYKPVSGRFKDYIAIPKANGYQSLHTTVLGPHGVPIEVQIRTEEMDKIAENGIAAHWLYKDMDADVDAESHHRTREWLQGLLEIQQNTGNSIEFIEDVKIDLYPDAVYVFTPKGTILSLPQGATPVDFAYAVHTDIGNECVGCKIDRRLAPLSTRLQSGQTVEILNSEGASPNPVWLSFAVTGKARSNIRHFLKNQQKAESERLGRRLINNALSFSKINIEELPEPKAKALLEAMNVKTLEELYEEVGLGRRLAPLVAQFIIGCETQSDENSPKEPLIIQGTEGLVIRYAHCCYPIPGDLIVGRLMKGRGVDIHAEHCSKVAQFKRDPLKCINVQWEDDVSGEFDASIYIDVLNGRGVLATLANAIAEANSNIVNVNVDERDGRHNSIKFIVSVRDRAHLARIMRRLRALPNVTRITRKKMD